MKYAAATACFQGGRRFRAFLEAQAQVRQSLAAQKRRRFSAEKRWGIVIKF